MWRSRSWTPEETRPVRLALRPGQILAQDLEFEEQS
jgi:hypothetical protein